MPMTPAGIHYEATGSGFPVVLLHGVLLDGSMWAAQVTAWSPRYRCLTVDRRGHGRSAPIGEIADEVADLLSVLDDAGVERAHLVGLSLGGHDALRFAGCHPERVASLTLAGAWLPVPAMTWTPPARLARTEGPEAGRRAFLADPLLAPALAIPEVREALTAMVERNDLGIWTRRTRPPEPAPPAAADLAPQVRVPTLVLVGERDLPPFHAVAAWLQATIPGAAGRPVAVVPRAGHMAAMEQPEAFSALVEGFWRSADLSRVR